MPALLLVLVGACAEKAATPAETGAGEDTSAPPPPARWSGEIALDEAAGATWLGEAAGDRFGRTLLGAGDVDGDGYDDLLLGAYYRSEGFERNGEAYLLLGPPAEWSGSLATPALSVLGEQDTAFVSRGMAGVGDMSGDGLPDLLIGAPNHDAGAGRACLFEGTAVWVRALSEGLACLVGEGGLLGAFVAAAGDLDGDGVADALVSAIFDARGGESAGSVSLLPGPVSPGEWSSADLVYWTGEAGDDAGWSVSGAGDVDGDGYADLLVGLPGADDAGAEAGLAALLRGPPPASGALRERASLLVAGASAGERAGMSVAGGGDLDGSGRPDLLIGSPGTDGGAGAAAVLLDPAVDGGTRSVAEASARWLEETPGAQAGFNVAMPGDLDGDGQDELLIGAFGGEAGTSEGRVLLIHGPPAEGERTSAEADAVFLGGEIGDFAGWFAAGAGDADGDGRPELLIGAQRSDRGGEEAGRAHWVPSGPADD